GSIYETDLSEIIPTSLAGDGAVLLIGEAPYKPVVLLGKGSPKSVEWYTSYEFPHSPGCLTSTFCQFLNLPDAGDLARLATYGNPESATFFHFYELIQERLVHMAPDGGMSLDGRYFRRNKDLILPHEKEWKMLFGLTTPKRPENLSQDHLDLALAAQRVVEDLVFALAARVRHLSGMKELYLSGRHALTPAIVGMLARTGLFDQIHFGKGVDRPEPARAEEEAVIADMAKHLAEGYVLCWCKNIRERFLLADPRRKDVKNRVNQLHRGSLDFPLDTLALAPEASAYLEMKASPQARHLSLQLLESYRHPVPPRYFGWPWVEKSRAEKSHFPAITHADFSVQTHFPSVDSFPGKLLHAFHRLSGCPLLGYGPVDRHRKQRPGDPKELVGDGVVDFIIT
ncbi:MAG: hypothetical protein IPJ40_24160, partial [Saprospirales bacterium]|nr:hypothetical protein [Saprospirales bacterium]